MRVSFEQLKQEFERVLLARGVQAKTAVNAPLCLRRPQNLGCIHTA